MNRFSSRLACLTLAAILVGVPASAQESTLRLNAQFRTLFEPVIAPAVASTVVVRSAGKDLCLGTIIGPDGWILTKYSELVEPITCRLPDGTESEARVVGVQTTNDLAVIKVEARDLKPIVWQDSGKVAVGDWLATVGISKSPVSVGVVSVNTRKMMAPFGPTRVQPGTQNGYLGIQFDSVTGGIVINNVQEDTPAYKAGLRKQDIIQSVNLKSIPDRETFQELLAGTKPGQEIQLKIRRDKEEKEITVKLGRRPFDLDRSGFQNTMGGELSKRRSGFTSILQTDAQIKPNECGGPVVDLEGKAVGINISRAGRPQTWVLPSEVIQPVLFDMLVGKLGNPGLTTAASTAPARSKLAQAEAARDVARLALETAMKKVAEAEKKVDQTEESLRTVKEGK